MLLLGYTPPLERDLRPLHERDGFFVECGHAYDHRTLLYWVHKHDDERQPLVPLLNVCTAATKHYREGSHEDHTTHIWFSDREGWRVAWRLARLLLRGGRALITSEEYHALDAIWTAPEHRIAVHNIALEGCL